MSNSSCRATRSVSRSSPDGPPEACSPTARMRTSPSILPLCVRNAAYRPTPGPRSASSLVTWPLRNSTAWEPVSASLPRSERSTRPQASLSVRYSVWRRAVSVAATALEDIQRSCALAGPGPISTTLARLPGHALGRQLQQIVDSLPDDWTDLELDLRIADESRYVEAAVYLVTCNAQPYSHHDWHWRLLVAHRFGHAAAAPTVHGTL